MEAFETSMYEPKRKRLWTAKFEEVYSLEDALLFDSRIFVAKLCLV